MPTSKYGYIYKCTYLKTGKIYIGQKTGTTIDKNYYGSGKKWISSVLQSCQNRSQEIQREIIEWCYSASQLNAREKYWINYYNATNHDIGYNISPGGHASSIEMRNAMSQTLTNVMKNIDIRQKISNTLKQYRQKHPFSQEHRKNLSESAKGNHNFGTHDTRNIPVKCVINNNEYYQFKNKIEAARWWHENFPISPRYVEITYTRKINDSINHIPLKFKGKYITQNIQWSLV